MLCWEDVQVDNFTNSTLLHWLHKQVDVLTLGELPGTHLPLQVGLVHFLIIDAVLLVPSMLTPSCLDNYRYTHSSM